MLSIEGIDAGYGATTILNGVSLNVQAGEVVTIVGANGAGKTTTLRTISGLIKPTAGRILFEGEDITRLSAHEIVDLGITLIPEGRQLFPDMTVRENLLMGSYRKGARAQQQETMEHVMDLFPRIRERLDQNASSLSGGEQQMVAIARGMMARPKLLMFEEPSLGLAPLTLLLFNQVSIVGFGVNWVAVPLVTFVLTPLALRKAASPVPASNCACACTAERAMSQPPDR